MSMSTHVVAVFPPDERWEKMKDVHDACESAKVSLPDEVADYFDGEQPNSACVTLNIDRHEAVEKWGGDMQSGFRVDLSKLPEHVKFIIFYNSY